MQKQIFEQIYKFISQHKELKIWIRCDDVGKKNDKFSRLNNLFIHYNTKAYYAVVPDFLCEQTINEIDKNKNVRIIQHGVSHTNNRANNMLELVDNNIIVSQCIEKGKQLQQVFGDKYCQILCPPWNKLEAGASYKLKNHYRGLSCYKNHSSEFDININATLDIIDWATCSYRGHEVVFEKIQQQANSGLIGLCLHHSKMNDDAFSFVEFVVSNFGDRICFVD